MLSLVILRNQIYRIFILQLFLISITDEPKSLRSFSVITDKINTAEKPCLGRMTFNKKLLKIKNAPMAEVQLTNCFKGTTVFFVWFLRRRFPQGRFIHFTRATRPCGRYRIIPWYTVEKRRHIITLDQVGEGEGGENGEEYFTRYQNNCGR